MLYLIVPPIIIIVTLGILLFIFSRKSSEFYRVKKENEKKESINSQGIASVGMHLKAGNFFSKIKENAVKKTKSIFMLIPSGFSRLGKKIKDRKKSGIDDAIKEDFKTEKKSSESEQGFKKMNEISFTDFNEKDDIPMVSKDVVKPESNIETKEELEKILIERIAVDPRDIEAYERLGDYYIEQESYRDAKECYRQVLKLSPINRKAKIRLNKITRMLGR